MGHTMLSRQVVLRLLATVTMICYASATNVNMYLTRDDQGCLLGWYHKPTCTGCGHINKGGYYKKIVPAVKKSTLKMGHCGYRDDQEARGKLCPPCPAKRSRQRPNECGRGHLWVDAPSEWFCTDCRKAPPQCEECNGSGKVTDPPPRRSSLCATLCSLFSTPEPGEDSEEACVDCGGTGETFDPSEYIWFG